MNKEIELLKKKIAREEAARKEAEGLLEKKSLELYHSNEQLKNLNVNLEDLVEKRTNKLRVTELEYQTMVESINDMIFRLDLQGNITFTNQIAHKIIGEENKELVGKNVLEFVSPEERKSIFIHFARQFLNRNCINYYEVSILSKYNKKIWLRLNVQFSSANCKLCVLKQQSLAGMDKEVNAKPACQFNEIILVAHDITQQRIGQERLEKSEKKYRELIESLPEMICEVDINGVLTYANKFAIDKFGYTTEEVLQNGFNIINIFPNQVKSSVLKNIDTIFRYGKSTSNEYLAKKKNGEEFSVIVYTTPIFENEKVTGLRGVMFDITDRKNQEMEIQNNLKQQVILSQISLSYNSLSDFSKKTNDALRVIGEHLDVSRVYIFEDSLDGEYTSNTFEWCNNGVESQKENLQEIPYALIPSWKKMLKEDEMIFSQDISELPKDVLDILEPQGIMSLLVLPLLERGKQMGFIGFDECTVKRTWRQSELELLRTISSMIANNLLRSRIQIELVQSEEENRIIIDSIPDLILHTNSEGEIKSLKSAKKSNLLNLLKIEANETIYTVLNKKLANLFQLAIDRCLVKGEYQFEFKNLNWDEIEYYEARLVKLNALEVLIIIRDVTVIKLNEKQLKIAKNRAEEASKMKSEFLANVSHEIRTPLNAILGFSQWLFDNTEISLHKEYLTTVISSGRHLLDVINDILDLSKIESGTMDIELQPMSYNEIISDIKMVFQDNIKEKGLSFKITTEKSVPDNIIMDETRFYQIIFNLVSNAIKFTSKGYVHVHAFSTKTEQVDEINLMISIEDSGIGIKKDEQDLIFESFTQQSGKINRSFEGTGLGLAIVGGLLDKLDASINLKSQLGKGTTFTLTFNHVKIDRSANTKTQLKDQKGSFQLEPCTIMIVDDIEFNIEVLKALIGNNSQINFIDAYDGKEALEKLAIEKPDIIFMDIRMPVLDGFDATRIIKENKDWKAIPVVAFSASTIKRKNDLIDQLFDGFLQKPVFKKDLEPILMKFLPHRFESPLLENKEEDTVVEELELEMEMDFVQKLPEIIKELEEVYTPMWEKIKGNLVIYEIEEFKNKLADLAFQNNCATISKYCSELDLGLQTFEIELIEKKLIDFPNLIEKLRLLQIG